jgi:hypothetical protein
LIHILPCVSSSSNSQVASPNRWLNRRRDGGRRGHTDLLVSAIVDGRCGYGLVLGGDGGFSRPCRCGLTGSVLSHPAGSVSDLSPKSRRIRLPSSVASII